MDSLVHLIYQDPLILIQIIPEERTQILAVSSGYRICEAQKNARERAASPLTSHLVSRTTPSSLAPGLMLSKTTMFVHVIVLDCYISSLNGGHGGYLSKEKTLFFEDLNGLLLNQFTTFPTTFVRDCSFQ